MKHTEVFMQGAWLVFFLFYPNLELFDTFSYKSVVPKPQSHAILKIQSAPHLSNVIVCSFLDLRYILDLLPGFEGENKSIYYIKKRKSAQNWRFKWSLSIGSLLHLCIQCHTLILQLLLSPFLNQAYQDQNCHMIYPFLCHKVHLWSGISCMKAALLCYNLLNFAGDQQADRHVFHK